MNGDYARMSVTKSAPPMVARKPAPLRQIEAVAASLGSGRPLEAVVDSGAFSCCLVKLQREIDRSCRVRQGSDADGVDAGGGDFSDGLEGDASGGLEVEATGVELDGFA